jgi:hypothetical protein
MKVTFRVLECFSGQQGQNFCCVGLLFNINSSDDTLKRLSGGHGHIEHTAFHQHNPLAWGLPRMHIKECPYCTLAAHPQLLWQIPHLDMEYLAGMPEAQIPNSNYVCSIRIWKRIGRV